MASSSAATLAVSSGDLSDLVASSGSTTVYPSDENILHVLHQRFRADLPYARIGAANMLVINPLKALQNTNDASAKEYEDRCYNDTSVPSASSPKALQPHLYELAANIYLLMRQRKQSQGVVFRSVFILASLPQPNLILTPRSLLHVYSPLRSRVVFSIQSNPFVHHPPIGA